MKELKPRDKVTQRMTRDGLVQDNQTTGESQSVSGRDAEQNLSPKEQPELLRREETESEDAAQKQQRQQPRQDMQPQQTAQHDPAPFQTSSNPPVSPIVQEAAPVHSGGMAGKVYDRVAAGHDAHTERKATRQGNSTIRQGEAARQRPSSRLQFTDEERSTPELQKYIRNSDRKADKLDAARAAVPKKTVITKERVFDEASGKGHTRLRFDKVDKAPSRLKHNPLNRPVSEAAAMAHGKIHEVEQENVGVESGHKAEELAERGIGRGVRSAYRHHKMKPYVAVEKAERAAAKANTDYLYHKALHDNPQLAGSNPMSRFFQKQKLKQEYAKAARAARSAGGTAKTTAQTTKKTAEASAKAAKRVAEEAKKAAAFVARHWKGCLIVLACFLLIVLLIGGLQSCSILFSGAGGGVAASTYQSEDADILAAEAAYCDMEAALQDELDNYESYHPGYDEYRFDLDEIEHDPYVLISILSALHEGAWTAGEVQGTLQMLFDKQYILTETIETETRYRTETRTGSYTVTDPETGESYEETYEYEVQVAYTYYICNVSLENFNLSHVPVYIMGEEDLSKYALYMSTLGNRPDLFGSSQYVDKYINSSYTDYDIPASALQDETFAAMIEEAEKYMGFPYVWGGSSPGTSFDCSGFVSYVLTNSGVCNTGRLGAQGLYNISTPVSSANVQPGDLVFFTGTYDTPGVSHVGIYVGNSMMIHCGDPISYSNLNSSYWQAHFYAYARPPFN